MTFEEKHENRGKIVAFSFRDLRRKVKVIISLVTRKKKKICDCIPGTNPF